MSTSASASISKSASAASASTSNSTIPATMSAIVIEQTGGPEVMKYKTDVPVPVPKGDEVLIKVDYVGVNYIDTYFRTGLYKAPHMPHTLGVECSGTIVSIGSISDGSDGTSTDTTHPHNLKPGDPVMAYAPSGAYATYTVAPISKTYALPATLSSPNAPKMTPESAAATLIGGLTALTLIREAHPVRADDWALVPAAAGGTGQWLCQLLAATGAHVIGTASTDEKLEVARKAGARVPLNSGMADDELVSRVMEVTEGKGVVAAFDGVGKATFECSMRCLGRKGTMVTFGNASGPVPDVAVFNLTPKNIKLCRPTLMNYIVTRNEFVTYCDELLALIDKHDISVNIHKVYPLKDAARAHQDLESRKTTGKLLLQP